MLNPTTAVDSSEIDTLLAFQSNPIVIAQLMAWHMAKQTADFPPQTIGEMRLLADNLNYCMAKLSPMVETVEFVVDGEEEGDQEEIG